MNDTLLLIILALPILALSIAFHEMLHALVSDALGDDTARHEGRVTLNPLKHIDPVLTVGLPLFLILLGLPPFGAARPVPFNPYRIKFGEFGIALVALAGPLTNLFLAVITGLLIRVTDPSGTLELILQLSLGINIGFFVFNMIPFPPLDGSRILYAFAPEPVQNFMRQIESTGFLGLIIFMFVIFPFLRPIFGAVVDFFLAVLV